MGTITTELNRFEYWKAVHHVTHQGEWATNSLLNMLFEEMRMYPEQQHFELATGGLLLIVDRKYNGEAYVTLAVTCHMIGDTRHAYDY